MDKIQYIISMADSASFNWIGFWSLMVFIALPFILLILAAAIETEDNNIENQG